MQKHDEWLLFARHDLMLAIHGLRIGGEVFLPAIYHTQQAAEKALKGFLWYRKHEWIPHTHDLPKLTAMCAKYDNSFNALLVIAAQLSPLATSFRYPEEFWSIPDGTEFMAAIDQAEDVIEFVENMIE